MLLFGVDFLQYYIIIIIILAIDLYLSTTIV